MNKKLILSAAAVAAIGAASFAAFNSNTPTREFSDLELANIEALTNEETEDVTKKCPGGTILCAYIIISPEMGYTFYEM